MPDSSYREQRAERLHIVLMPGLPGVGWLFAPMLRLLPSWLSPVVISYPTSRMLNYDELVELVRRKIPATGRYVLLGDSFSGPVAVRLAAENPRRLVALVLVATFVTNPLPRIMRLLRWLIRPALFRTATPRSLVCKWLLSEEATAEEAEFIARAIDAVSPRVLAGRIREVLGVDVRRELVAVRVPILYLWGKHDRVLTDRACKVINALRPDVAMVSLDGPHVLLLRNLPETITALENFLSPRDVHSRR